MQSTTVADEIDLKEALIAYWPLNENVGSQAIDLINSQNGILMGGAKWAPGIIGSGIDTKGGGYIQVPASSDMQVTDSISIQLWTKIRSFGMWKGLFGYLQDNGDRESGYCLYTSGKGIDWYISTGRFTTVSSECPLNQWLHIVGTYDGRNMKLYINGKQVGAKPASGPVNWKYKPREMSIGRYFDDNEDYRCDAVIDEVAVWKRCLTEKEITLLYNNGKASGLIRVPYVYLLQPEDSTKVYEGGKGCSYTLSLATKPSFPVKIKVQASRADIDLGSGPGKPLEIFFSTEKWNKSKSITVNAVDDNLYEGLDLQASDILHSIQTDDPVYSKLKISSAKVFIVDNDFTCGDFGYLKTDLNKDCYVDILDLCLFLKGWIESSGQSNSVSMKGR